MKHAQTAKKRCSRLLAMMLTVTLAATPISALAAEEYEDIPAEIESAAELPAPAEEPEIAVEAYVPETAAPAAEAAEIPAEEAEAEEAEPETLAEEPETITPDEDVSEETGDVPAAEPEIEADAEDAASGELESDELPMETDGAAETSYYVSRTVSAVLRDGVLTIRGTGEIPGYVYEEERPWNGQIRQITAVVIERGITSIGCGAFSGCTNLSRLSIANTVTEIWFSAFSDCSSLAQVSLPASVTMLDGRVFAGCTALTSVTAPGLRTLEDYPFANTGLTSFQIPKTLQSIHPNAFTDSSVREITVESGSPYFTAIDGVLFTADESTLVIYPFAKPDRTYAVPSKVTQIERRAFMNNQYLETIDLGNVTAIQLGAFESAQELRSVTLPDTLKEVGLSVFTMCPKLQSVTFGAGLKSTSYHMFSWCPALTEISFGGLQEISRLTFVHCTSLRSARIPSTVTFVSDGAFDSWVNIVCENPALVRYGTNGFNMPAQTTVTGTRDYSQAFEVLSILNRERRANGLPALVMDQSLLNTAMLRAAELTQSVSHTRPNGSQCFTANDAMLGENIAAGHTSASAVMSDWMGSNGHRANILNSEYTTVGIGCFIWNGTRYWTQCFGRGSATSNCAKPSNTTVTETIALTSAPREDYGWLQLGGKWYFITGDIIPYAFGWLSYRGNWYFLDTNTAEMVTGWANIDGSYYHFADSGAMNTGWYRDTDGSWYYLGSSGAMRTGWQNVGGYWYYMDPDTGAMQTGFQTIRGVTYYLNASGAMATGWARVNGNWYYFASSGAMKTGWQKIGGYWYYMDPRSGAMQTGFKTVGGATYYLQSSGAMATGWARVNGSWYYFNASGAMLTSSWIRSGRNWYYLKANGVMAANETVNGGYYVNASGVWVR